MFRAVSATALVASAQAANWAVITAGSKSYSNYRHQADACHAYQVVKSQGIPEENIITMMYDDIASNSNNPFPGKLFNKPDPTGPGKDVYEGCNIDYKGADVTPETFTNVISGTGSGKVLKSTEEDTVFVFFSDHGAPGLIAFPDDVLHVQQFQAALQSASDNKLFKKLVFYLETCESGSMFQGLSVPNVYAVSAASPTESSWGTYCGSDAQVNGKSVGSCLGDLFSVAWMEDADSKDMSTETLQQQYEAVKTRVDKSAVTQWGDTSFTSDTMASVLGGASNQSPEDNSFDSQSENNWETKDQHVKMLMHRYQHAKTGTERLEAAEELQAELQKQIVVERVHRRLAAIVYPDDEAAQKQLRRRKEEPVNMQCELDGHRALKQHCQNQFDAESGFALWFHQVVVNVCHDQSNLNLNIETAMEQACKDVELGMDVVRV